MAKVRIREEADCRLISAKEYLIEKSGSDLAANKYSEETLNTKLRIFADGSGSLQLIEAQVLPNTVTAVHAHDADEIIYILEGEILVGNRSLGRGSAIFIEAKTLYGYKTGPEGVRLLNFRPRRIGVSADLK
jgi:hypothetical protein